MRARLLAGLLALTLVLAAVSPGVALAQSSAANDGSRVPVQLVVFGTALLLVVGVGTLAYVVRKKLGLDAPPAPEDASPHH